MNPEQRYEVNRDIFVNRTDRGLRYVNSHIQEAINSFSHTTMDMDFPEMEEIVETPPPKEKRFYETLENGTNHVYILTSDDDIQEVEYGRWISWMKRNYDRLFIGMNMVGGMCVKTYFRGSSTFDNPAVYTTSIKTEHSTAYKYYPSREEAIKGHTQVIDELMK